MTRRATPDDVEVTGDLLPWIDNTGTPPEYAHVDLMLNGDEEDWPGVQMIRYDQRTKEWDWTISQADPCAIKKYRKAIW